MPTDWTPEQQADALALIREAVPYREVRRRTGIPLSTLSRWAQEAGISTDRAADVAAATTGTQLKWAQRRAALADEIGTELGVLLDKAIDAEKGSDASGFATAFGILVDKAQLLTGGATSRSEQVGLERQRERVLAMQDELAERRALKDGTTGG